MGMLAEQRYLVWLDNIVSKVCNCGLQLPDRINIEDPYQHTRTCAYFMLCDNVQLRVKLDYL